MTSMPVHFIVVRHGESIGNAAKRLEEKGDTSLIERLKGTHTAHWPLTKKGREQAQKTGEYLNRLMHEGGFHFDRLYVSSYARARQTAAALELVRARWRVDTRITERDWGILDRMTEEERHEKFGEDIRMRHVEPFFWCPPQGESMNAVVLRVRDFIDSVHRANIPTTVVVVCHGEVAKAFRINFCQLTPEEYAEMEFSKNPLERIHNCQVDHYSRRGPHDELSTRLDWLRVCRPSEGQDVAIDWKPIPRREYTNHEIAIMGDRLSQQFSDIGI